MIQQFSSTLNSLLQVCDKRKIDPPHTGLVISEVINEIIMQWGLKKKVCTITLDNVTSNDVAARNLKTLFRRKLGFAYMRDFFHVRCCAHILNFMVQDGLKKIGIIIEKVRESVLYIKRSIQSYSNPQDVQWCFSSFPFP